MGRTSTVVKTRYNSKTYDRIVANIPKATGEAFKAKCKADGVPQTHSLNAAIDAYTRDALSFHGRPIRTFIVLGDPPDGTRPYRSF